MDENDISSYYPMDTYSVRMPLWVSPEFHIQESATTLSGNLSLEMGNPSPSGHNVKQMDFLIQDKGSSSTQSTGQSVGSIEEGISSSQNFISAEQEGAIKHEVMSQLKTISSIGFKECVIPSQVNFGQSYACVPLPYTDPYYGGLLSQSMLIKHPWMVGIGPARVPLPLDLLQNEPIYVNAKQYHAILRRRQYRAKLEAQNKLSKGRKPYLHESRHLHALKRARGTGGRFINTKSLQNSKNAATTEDNLTKTRLRTATNMPKSKPFYSKVFDHGFSATSGSDISDISNIDNEYQHQEFRFSLYPSSSGSYYSENQCT